MNYFKIACRPQIRSDQIMVELGHFFKREKAAHRICMCVYSYSYTHTYVYIYVSAHVCVYIINALLWCDASLVRQN